MPSDTEKLRATVAHIFPDLVIDGVARESGQRVVYYCHFEGPGLAAGDEVPWSSWGNVVMKICTGIDAATIAYMQMEIEVLNSLNSPYFPRLHWNDLYIEDPITEEKFSERLFVSIEQYIESTPLSQCEDQFCNESAVISLILELIEGASLLWLHERKLVHRDLKPDNILIRPTGKPVIIDLGILRETGSKGVTQTMFWGPMTLNYAAPEQVNYDKKAISFKTDLFSLATIAYELLAKKNPYIPDAGNSAHEIANNILALYPTNLEELGVASSQFSQIIRRMMQKEPYRRYRSVDTLRNDLIQAKEKVDD